MSILLPVRGRGCGQWYVVNSHSYMLLVVDAPALNRGFNWRQEVAHVVWLVPEYPLDEDRGTVAFTLNS
jgi:hypothetical protein